MIQKTACRNAGGFFYGKGGRYLIGKYIVCYCDPPWRYAQKGVQGAAEKHYPTMSIEELCALPVADLMAPDSALFLWATFPQLPEALRLIRAWGFSYKTVALVRLKQNRKSPGWFYGLGFWTRGNAEVCLLATRGRPRRQAANIHQFIISPVEAHSKKPDEARDKIVAYSGPPQSRKTLWGEEEGRRGYGGSAIGGNGMQRVSSDEDVPRVELFARQTPSGWDVWGNEVEPSAGLRDTLSHSTQTGGVV